MRTLAAILLATVLAVPVASQAQDDFTNRLGAAAAIALAEKYMGVNPDVADDWKAGAFRSRSAGYKEIDATYPAESAAECRLASALVVMGLILHAQRSSSHGEWSANLDCGGYRVNVRLRSSPTEKAWWITEYDSQGREIYTATNQQ